MDDKYKNTIAGKWVEARIKALKNTAPKLIYDKVAAEIRDVPDIKITRRTAPDIEYDLYLTFPEFHALCKWGMGVLGEEEVMGLKTGVGVADFGHLSRIHDLENENEVLAQTVRDQEKEIKYQPHKDPPKTIFPYPVRFRAPQPGHRPPCCPCCDKDMVWNWVWKCDPCGLRISQEEE